MKNSNFILSQKIGDKIIEEQISYSEFLEIEKAHQALEHIQFFLWRIKETEMNYNDLHNSLEACQIECKTTGLNSERIQEIFININRLFINFITGLKFFIDNMDKTFRTLFGENSKEYLKFKNFCTYNYETYFSYRFFYNLRNYCQHNNYPIYNFSQDKFYHNGQIIRKEFRVEFNRDKLMQDKTLSRKLKFDWLKYGEKFPIQPQLKEILIPIKRIEPIIFDVLQKNIINSISKVKNMQKRANRLDLELTYGMVTQRKRVIHFEHKINQYKLAIELEKKLNKHKYNNFT